MKRATIKRVGEELRELMDMVADEEPAADCERDVNQKYQELLGSINCAVSAARRAYKVAS